MATRFLMIFALPFLMYSCDFMPRDVTFYVWEEERWSDGRFLMVNFSDSVQVKEKINPTNHYDVRRTNLYCQDQKDMILKSDSDWNASLRIWPCFPIRVHRASGRVDTLYCFGNQGCFFSIGYISACATTKDWLIIESKVPGKILGREHLANEKIPECDVYMLFMGHYTYIGQKKVFESRKVDYWIANQHSYDIFGPLTKKQLKVQMQKLKIPLPMKLDGYYDRYSYAFDSTGFFLSDEPKEFLAPHHREREGILID